MLICKSRFYKLILVLGDCSKNKLLQYIIIIPLGLLCKSKQRIVDYRTCPLFVAPKRVQRTPLAPPNTLTKPNNYITFLNEVRNFFLFRL